MARLYLPAQLFDENGDPLAGGKVYTYDGTATTTPKATYSNVGLTVPHANPIEADADGFIPDVFATAGESYFCVIKTAADEAVGEDLTIEALGGDSTSSLTRVFDVARWNVTSGDFDGISSILYEHGPSSPTNTGGYAAFTGWDATQGDRIDFDFADANFTGTLDVAGAATVGGALAVVGAITENGKKLTGIVQTAATSFTTSSTVDIALPNTPSGARKYVVEIFDLVSSHSTNTVLSLRLAYDSTPTFKTGASDYAYVLSHATYSGGAASGGEAGSAATSSIALTGGGTDLYPQTNYPAYLRIEIVVATSSGPMTLVNSEAVGWVDATPDGFGRIKSSGYGLGGYGRATYMRLFPGAGTLSGKYRVAVERGYGE